MIKLWLLLLPAMIHVESTNDPQAYNVLEQAAGILQIRPKMLKDVNRILRLQKKTKRYTLADRYDIGHSIQMFFIVMTHYKCNTILKVCRRWNGKGPSHKIYMLKLIRRIRYVRRQ